MVSGNVWRATPIIIRHPYFHVLLTSSCSSFIALQSVGMFNSDITFTHFLFQTDSTVDTITLNMYVCWAYRYILERKVNMLLAID